MNKINVYKYINKSGLCGHNGIYVTGFNPRRKREFVNALVAVGQPQPNAQAERPAIDCMFCNNIFLRFCVH